MRWLVTCVAGVAFLIVPPTLAPKLMPAALACAGTIVNACGKFSFWVPDDWKPAKEATGGTERSTYESPDGLIWVVVSPLADRNADLMDEDITDFIDEELDEQKVTSDKREKLEKYDVRVLEGAGLDEGEAAVYKALALDPGAAEGVIMVLVYGERSQMRKTENEVLIDRILRSLRPQ